MYYHPSLLDGVEPRGRPEAEHAVIELLVESIHRQQTVQIGALEIVARLGEIAADTQRHLVHLLGNRAEGNVPAQLEERGDEPDTVRGDASAGRRQMIG